MAGMVPEPMAYRWSSHRDYLGRRTVPWLDTDFVLGMFGPTVGVARVRYARFMRSYADEDLALFEKHESRDTRSLEPELPKVTAPAPLVFGPGDRATLEQIAARHCASAGITAAELVSPSRDRRLSRARAAIALEALTAGVACVSSIARYFGRSPSALAQQLTKLRSGTF
jgi:hypothetical protein